jgi:hypothetical protein
MAARKGIKRLMNMIKCQIFLLFSILSLHLISSLKATASRKSRPPARSPP